MGKAKNLRKRLASYFGQSSSLAVKTRVLVSQVKVVDFLCTASEKEALLLEASLIKKHRPKYNIVLRDDKAYLLFRLDKQAAYPRLEIARRVFRDRARYFGPFTSAQAARTTLRVLNRIFPLRKCKDRVFKNRARPCLQYQLGRCLAPCVLPVPKNRYADLVRQVELFLQGRAASLLKELEQEMLVHAEQLEFEQAARIRDQIQAIKKTIEGQNVIFADGREMDVIELCPLNPGFGLSGSGLSGLGLVVLFVRQGKVLGLKHFFWSDQAWTGPEKGTGQTQGQAGKRAEFFLAPQDCLASFLLQFYAPGRYIPGQIILPLSLQDSLLTEILAERRGTAVKIRQARSRAEKRLLDLARENIEVGLAAGLHSSGLKAAGPRGAALRVASRQEQAVLDLVNRLHLQQVPRRIEAIDASHFYGQGMIVGQVVWQDGMSLKSAYRIYGFPELEGKADDYLALSSWARRRLSSDDPLPDLVVVDGGPGQLLAIAKGMQDRDYGSESCFLRQQKSGSPALCGQASPVQGLPWQMVGIVKASRKQGELEDKVYLPFRKNPVNMPPGSPALLFLQDLRDQVHRFVLTRMRQGQLKRLTSESLEAVLLDLPGIGPGLASVLTAHYKTREALLGASADDLKGLPGIGRHRSQFLVEVFKNLEL